MRYMGWTWAEFEATPVSVIETIREQLREEADAAKHEDGGFDPGPRARQREM